MLMDDAFFDDFFDEDLSKWECPECKKNNKSSEVKLYQASEDTAIFFCPTNGCLYPYTENVDTFTVRRNIYDIPATEEMLTKVGFPIEMYNPNLKCGHIHDLVWLKNFIPCIDKAIETKKRWKDLMEDVEETFKIHDNKSWGDPDLFKLINLPQEVVSSAKYLKPDIEDVISMIKSDYDNL